MKKLHSLVLIFPVLATSSCLTLQENVDNKLTVKVHNRTEEDVELLKIGNTYIGHIDKDSSSTYISFPYFITDSGYPFEEIRANINDAPITSSKRQTECSSSVHKIEYGNLEFDLIVVDGHLRLKSRLSQYR